MSKADKIKVVARLLGPNVCPNCLSDKFVVLQRLRAEGAFIYSEKADKKKKMCLKCGADRNECRKLKTHNKR